jgi:3-oxoacyl-[acyl-carrier-protein] synthase I
MNQASHSSNDKPKVYIAATGMITPVGANTATTIAAVNAGINQYKASSFVNKKDKPMTTASVPEDALPPLHEDLNNIQLTGREKRLVRLAMPALEEVFSYYPLEQPLPLFLAGPESIYPGVKTIAAQLLKYVQIQSGAKIDLPNSRYFAMGRTGVFEAIALAFRYFAATNAPYVLVGGVDSYLDVATLSYLDAEDRVLAENMNNAFAPGEGASFILLRNSQIIDSNSQHNVAIFQPGLAIEKGHRYSNELYFGQGLDAAFKVAIANGSNEKIATIYSSMNGESFFAKEFGVASIRNRVALNENYTHEHPIDCFGDMGAAIPAVLIALAQHKLLKNKKHLQNLVYCSSDLASRTAVCIATNT